MKRRDFSLGLALAALDAALPASAQQPGRRYRIGVLLSRREPDLEAMFVDALSREGFVQGRNLEIKWMHSPANEGISDQARGLVGFRPDALLSEGVVRTRTLQNLAPDIPIVFVAADPVASGLVNSLAHPGGNTTGVSTQECVVLTKQVQLLKELAPNARKLHIVMDGQPGALSCKESLEAAGPELRVVALAPGEGGMTATLQSLARGNPDGAVVWSARKEQIVQALSTKGVPIVSHGLKPGIVLAFYADPPALVRRQAELIARILRGAKPSELPVELVTRFKLEVDVRQARQMGIRVPESILLRADRVVQ